MAMHPYRQYCGVGRGLELVGERWALLIMRDLMVGPRRFTDLREGLPGIALSTLATRLKELESYGLIRRRPVPLPQNGVVYEVTEYGAELEPVVLELGRWGARRLGDPGEHEILTASALAMAVRAAFRPDQAAALRVRVEIRVGQVVAHAVIGDRKVGSGVGGLPDLDLDRDLVIETGRQLGRLLRGELSAEQALAAEHVRLTGATDRFALVVRSLQMPLIQLPGTAPTES